MNKYYYSILTLRLRKEWVLLAFNLTPRFMQKRLDRLWSQIVEYEETVDFLKRLEEEEK